MLEPDRVARLERKIGQKTLEIDFFKGCLQCIQHVAAAGGCQLAVAVVGP